MRNFIFSYLRFWATGYLKRAKPQIVAITGSVGKTSTKEAIFEVLSIKFGSYVRKSQGNLNTETGVPLAILNFKNAPVNAFGWFLIIIAAPFKSLLIRSAKVLVLELAADKPGDITYLTSFVKPDIAVLTSIGAVHMAAYKSLDNIIEEKTNLLRALDSYGTAILNVDDENVKKVSYGGRYAKKTYGLENEADVKGTEAKIIITDGKPKTEYQILFEKEKVSVEQEILGGKGLILASLAAFAVGKVFAMSNTEIARGLSHIDSEKHCLSFIKGRNGTLIVDDSYNANPLSVKAALDLLRDLQGGRKIAVLGDMRELGKISAIEHKKIGDYAKEVSDIFIAEGKEAKNFESTHFFTMKQDAIDFLLKEIKQNDIILVKASRSMKFEKIVDALKE